MQNSKFDSNLSLNLTINSGGDKDTEFIDCISSLEDLEEDILKAERIYEVRKAVAKLPSDEMELVIVVYYSKASLKVYAEKKA